MPAGEPERKFWVIEMQRPDGDLTVQQLEREVLALFKRECIRANSSKDIDLRVVNGDKQLAFQVKFRGGKLPQWTQTETISDAAIAPPPIEVSLPWLLAVFGLSLSKQVRIERFEPSFHDLQNEYYRLAHKRFSRSQLLLIHAAFGLRCFRIAAECLISDWLSLSWKQFGWFVIVVLAGGNAARFLYSFFK